MMMREMVTTTGDLDLRWDDAVIADKDYVLAALHNDDIAFLDARSPAEYRGEKSAAARHGRIPGAVNFNWLDTMNADDFYRFKQSAELSATLAKLGVTPDHEVITYCQTHHRSAHSFMMLRHLGFARVRGYPGSWSEWGNDASLPIET